MYVWHSRASCTSRVLVIDRSRAEYANFKVVESTLTDVCAYRVHYTRLPLLRMCTYMPRAISWTIASSGFSAAMAGVL